METYVYQAAMYCADCAARIKSRLECGDYAPADPSDESSYDSDEYPKGPYGDGGGEADSPCHCGECGVFLENPLTTDGEKYVRQAVADASFDRLQAEPFKMWREYYSYVFRDEESE